ncbi:MAG: hypothetical protein ACJ73U_16470, partial [Actinophytocola sp.]
DRLARVEARLALIRKERLLPVHDVRVKQVPPLRIFELSAIAPSFETGAIASISRLLFGRLHERIERTAGEQVIVYYEPCVDRVVIHVGIRNTEGLTPSRASAGALVMVELPAAEVAVLIHEGTLAGVDAAWQEVAIWLDDNNHSAHGNAREIHAAGLAEDEQQVTELQQPISRHDHW